MSDFGLLSVLPWTFYAALALLTWSFAALAARGRARGALLGAHLVALVALLHATPVLLYGTLRYSWAWKHVGIVDYIQRHGAVDTGIESLTVYHNWPGFFGLDALATQLAGLGGALGQALWGPVFFNLLNLAALVFLFSGMTRDRRIVWLATWLFFVTSWVGQDYYSPQAFAFTLYLVLLGLVVRGLRGRPAWLAAAVALIAVIAVSHPLTAVMTVVALAALVVARGCDVRSLPLVAGAMTIGWNVTFAAQYVGQGLGATIKAIHLPWRTTASNLTSISDLSAAQALVALVSRGLVVAICLLALVGLVRWMRSGDRRGMATALALAVAPVVLFGSGDYDGELIFRVYLFGLPFVAFVAARAFLPAAGRRRAWSPPAVAFAAAATVLLAAFLFPYYGNERQFYFTPDEVAAATWVYTRAPPGSLLVEGTRNYPGQFRNYERFTYVPIAREPADSQRRLLAHPAAVLAEWMRYGPHADAFLIITRAQKAEVDELGAMPRGSLDRIERALLGSRQFTAVVHNRDAVVFRLAEARAR